MAKPRDWAIRADDYDSTEEFRNAVRQSLLDCEAIQFREGGVFIVAPLRVERAEKLEGVREFETLGVRFSHDYLPAAKPVVQDEGAVDEEVFEALEDHDEQTEEPLDLDEVLEAQGLEVK
jgi:hypothetical protein